MGFPKFRRVQKDLFHVLRQNFLKAQAHGRPKQGGMIDLDGQKYIVVDATDECGIYAITMEANKSHGGRRA